MTEPTHGNPSCDVCFDFKFSPQRTRHIFGRRWRDTPGLNFCSRQIQHLERSGAEECQLCAFIVKAVSYFGMLPADDSTVHLSITEAGAVAVFSPSLSITMQIYTPIGRSSALIISDLLTCISKTNRPLVKDSSIIMK